MPKKVCIKCGLKKDFDDFFFNSRQGKHIAQCKACIRAKQQAYRAANPEKVREQHRKHYLRNKGKYYLSHRKWRLEHADYLKEYRREYYKRSDVRKRCNELNRRRNAKLKKMVFDHYGNQCACCGETEQTFLTIDHVNNDGFKERKEIKGDKIYGYIIKKDFPDSYQILCWNCNIGKHLNGGACPHKTSEGSTTIPKGSTLQAIGSGSADLLGNKDEDIVSSAWRHAAAGGK